MPKNYCVVYARGWGAEYGEGVFPLNVEPWAGCTVPGFVPAELEKPPGYFLADSAQQLRDLPGLSSNGSIRPLYKLTPVHSSEKELASESEIPSLGARWIWE